MKPQLEYLYTDWYTQVVSRLSTTHGKILELGSGPGFVKSFIPSALTSDIRCLPGLDIDFVLDARNIGDMFPQTLY